MAKHRAEGFDYSFLWVSLYGESRRPGPRRNSVSVTLSGQLGLEREPAKKRNGRNSSDRVQTSAWERVKDTKEEIRHWSIFNQNVQRDPSFYYRSRLSDSGSRPRYIRRFFRSPIYRILRWNSRNGASSTVYPASFLE